MACADDLPAAPWQYVTKVRVFEATSPLFFPAGEAFNCLSTSSELSVSGTKVQLDLTLTRAFSLKKCNVLRCS